MYAPVRILLMIIGYCCYSVKTIRPRSDLHKLILQKVKASVSDLHVYCNLTSGNWNIQNANWQIEMQKVKVSVSDLYCNLTSGNGNIQVYTNCSSLHVHCVNDLPKTWFFRIWDQYKHSKMKSGVPVFNMKMPSVHNTCRHHVRLVLKCATCILPLTFLLIQKQIFLLNECALYMASIPSVTRTQVFLFSSLKNGVYCILCLKIDDFILRLI